MTHRGRDTWMTRMTRIAAPLVVVVALNAGAAWREAHASGDGAGPAIARGTAYLLSQQQPDGSWDGHVGITAVALLALMPPPATDTGPVDAIARGLAFLARSAQPDGGIYQEDVRHYTTAVAVLAMAASGDPRYRKLIAAAREYLLGLQAREDNGFPPSHPLHGGTLIGGGKANLDATYFSARAMTAAGLAPDHASWARAVRFTSRCQNWEPTNDQPWATSDGGAVFAPGFSFAGGTTSYGTMTYAALGVYRAAGLPRTDERVEAALAWVRRHFTVDENPGLAKQTLYHSYFYLSSALGAWGVDGFTDGSGRTRAWRPELITALRARQRADGSWANTDDPRWWESRPVLATSFAVRALKEAIR